MRLYFKFIFLLCFFLSEPSYSQNLLGIQAAVGVSNIRYGSAIENEIGFNRKREDIHVKLGLEYQYQLKKKWSLSTALVYQTRGYSELWNADSMEISNTLSPYYCYLDAGRGVGVETIKQTYRFVQIPLKVNYTLLGDCEDCGWDWIFGAGPTFNIPLSHQAEGNIVVNSPESCVELEPFCWGAIISAGLKNEFDNGQYLSFLVEYDFLWQTPYNESYQQYFYYVGLSVSFGLRI